MSFDVHLLASSVSPTGHAFEAKIDEAIARTGATGSVATEQVRTSDGMEAELFAAGGEDAMFVLRGFSVSLAEVIFAAADATSSFILASGEHLIAFRTPSNLGEPTFLPDDGFPPIVPVDNGKALAEALGDDFGAWSDYRDQIMPSAKSSFSAEPQEVGAAQSSASPTSSFLSRLMAGLTGKR